MDDDGKISLDEYEFLVLKSLEKAGIRIEYLWKKKNEVINNLLTKKQ